ncbi:Dicer-like protein 1 [Gurleya vavrai]
MVLTLKKFACLASQALIKIENYKFVIFRLDNCNKEVVEAFQIINWQNKNIKIFLITFLNIINKDDNLLINSKTYQKDSSDMQEIILKTKIHHLFIKPIQDAEIESYAGYKRYLNKMIEIKVDKEREKLIAIHNKIIFLENVTYKYALHLLKMKFKYVNNDKFELNEDYKHLVIKDQKYRRLIKLISQVNENKIYIVLHHAYLLEYLQGECKNNNKITFFDPEKSNSINFDNSILVLYDFMHVEEIKKNYKKIYIFYEENDFTNVNTVNEMFLEEFKDHKTLKMKKETEEPFLILESGAITFFDSAYIMLFNFFTLVQNMYKDEYFYLKSVNLNCKFIEKDNLFKCFIDLPSLHENLIVQEGSFKTTKGDARKCASIKALQFLYKNNFMDKYICPIKFKFIDSNVFFYKMLIKTYEINIQMNKKIRIESVNEIISNLNNSEIKKKIKNFYEDSKDEILKKSSDMDLNEESINENISQIFDFEFGGDEKTFVFDLFFECVNEIGIDNDKLKNIIKQKKEKYYEEKISDPSITQTKAKIMFQKENGITLDSAITKIKEKKETKNYQCKQAEVFKNYPEKFYIYVAKDLNDKNDSFDLGIATGESFKGKIIYPNYQVEMICKVKFTEEQLKCLINMQIILFKLHFKNIKECNENFKEYCFLFVPLKNRKIDLEIINSFSSSRFLINSVYENINIKLLKNNFLYNPFNKQFCLYDKESKRQIDEIETFAGKEKTFLEYFEEKYNTELTIKEGNDLVFDGFIYNGKETGISNVLSSEIMQITSIERNICKKYNESKSLLFILERIFLSYEFMDLHKLKISNQIVLQCFTAKDESFNDYERLEFLGDCVLKFVAVKYIFLTDTDSMGDIVTRKDKIISNEALFKIADQMLIPNYFSFIKYSENMFQPPSIYKLYNKNIKDDCINFLNYFEAENIFKSRNITVQENKSVYEESKIKGMKVYADIVEALIGAYFVQLNFKESEQFIYQIGIIKLNDIEKNIKIESDNKNENYEKNITNDLENKDKNLEKNNCKINYEKNIYDIKVFLIIIQIIK